jgi:nucleotide sugar dehydrogenase
MAAVLGGFGSSLMRIAVVGCGYVGTVTATCLAWLGHSVTGLESDPERVGPLSRGAVPFYEPGLRELMAEVQPLGRLAFTADPATGIRPADVVFVCVGTPPDADDRPDLTQLREAALTVARHARVGAVVVGKSTVPIGSGDWLGSVLDGAVPPLRRGRVHVVANPEFLREGSAIEDFLFPDRIVLGGDHEPVEKVARVYRPVLDQAFPGGDRSRLPELFVMDRLSAEMVKYAANAALATKISLANEIATLCELTGADARTVLPAVGADQRIGSGFLRPGLGWGGSCLPKDTSALVHLGADLGYDMPLLRAVREVNARQPSWAACRLEHALGVLSGRRIAILGLSFKPATDDLRSSPALVLARALLDEGAEVVAFDPVVKRLPGDDADVVLATDPYDAATDADAVVVATDWPEFHTLDFDAIRERMRGEVVLDGRNLLADGHAARSGLRILGAGWHQRSA